MADDVTVTFGASIEKLLAGINGGTDAVKQFASQVGEISSTVGELASALGLAFSVEKLVEFVGKMAELGEQTERTAAMLGVSVKEAQELGFMATVTGGSAEGLALSMERLQVNLQKAQAGTGPASQALQALGLSAKELIGLPIDQQMNRIADSVARFADGGNKTAIVMELLGRGGAQMIPVLDQGTGGLDNLRGSAERVGAVMSGTTIGVLANMSTNLTTLKGAATGLGGTLVSILAPAINDAVHGLTEWISGINATLQAHKLWERAIEDIRFVLKDFLDLLLTVGAVAKDVFTLNWADIAQHWRNGLALGEETLKDHMARLKAIIEPARAEMQRLLSIQEPGSALPQAPGSGAPNKDAIGAAMKDIDGQIQVMREGLTQKKTIFDAEAAQFQITQDQKFAMTQTAVQQEAAAEEKLLQQELQIGNLSVSQRQVVENKIAELKAKTNTELIKLDEQSIAAQQKMWLGYIDTITGAFNSQLKGLLQGTVTWTQAMKNMLLDLTTKFIEMVEKWGAEWLAGQLGMTTATTTGAAARAAAEQAATTATLPARAGKFVSDITADAALAFAGIFANLSPLLGPAAAGPAAAGQATVLAELANVPKLDVGGFVISSGLAMIHQGETVEPAQTAPLGGGNGGAGGGVHFHFGTVIGTQQWISQIKPQLAAAVGQYFTRNPSMRPAY